MKMLLLKKKGIFAKYLKVSKPQLLDRPREGSLSSRKMDSDLKNLEVGEMDYLHENDGGHGSLMTEDI